MEAVEMLLWMALCGLLGSAMYLFNALVLKPGKIRSRLQRQGIRGPPSRFLLGNIPDMQRLQVLQQLEPIPEDISHEWFPRLFPHLHQWQNEYGSVFLYASGNLQQLCVTDPFMVREFSIDSSWDLGKPSYLRKDRGPLLGEGILTSNGSVWAQQRKIISPQFYADRVKGFVGLMVDCTNSMSRSWESKIISDGGTGNLRVDNDLRCLSGDIISRACFGSNHSQGNEIFSKLDDLKSMMSKVPYGVPGLRYLPTKINRQMRKLKRKIDELIVGVVEERQSGASKKDLLQAILETAKSFDYRHDSQTPRINLYKFIIHNCKNIYFAGYETTSITASWCMFLLALNPDWQARVRAEVLGNFKEGFSCVDTLPNMKLLTMVIQETLRLYPPAIFWVREALRDVKFGDLRIPRGTVLIVPTPKMHQNPEIWGNDTHEFNPLRFEHGTIGACKVPQVYMPFGLGPRTCAGQNFAMTELKVILSIVLSRFELSLSPSYRHAPIFRLVVEPEHGVHLLLRRLN